jgi:hypothetical protein
MRKLYEPSLKNPIKNYPTMKFLMDIVADGLAPQAHSRPVNSCRLPVVKHVNKEHWQNCSRKLHRCCGAGGAGCCAATEGQ